MRPRGSQVVEVCDCQMSGVSELPCISSTIAAGLTDWNQPTGNSQPPRSRSTMFWARKLKELPACSKNIQNSTLKAKMISIATTLSRATLPLRS